jgi:hypothetical protein
VVKFTLLLRNPGVVPVTNTRSPSVLTPAATAPSLFWDITLDG